MTDTLIHLDPGQDEELIFNGFSPVPISDPNLQVDNAGKAPFIEGWRTGDVTFDRIVEWRTAHPDHRGTGIRTDNTPGVDIDIVDKEHCKTIGKIAAVRLGNTPLVRKGSKGMMLVYRSHDPMKKIRIVSGDKTLLEVLGVGQQFVAFGEHPKTRQPYKWLSTDTPLTVHADSLPVITPDQTRAFVKEAAAELIGLGYENVRITGDTGDKHEASASTGAPIVAKTLTDILSLAKDGKAVFDPGCSRDEWRDAVAAIGWANVPDGDAKEIACAWSRGEYEPTGKYKDITPDNYSDDDAVLTVIETMPPKEGGVNIGSIIHKAQENGWGGNPFGNSVQVFSPLSPEHRPKEKPDFTDIGNNGAIKATTPNCRIALEALGLQCSHDVFHDRLIISGHVLSQSVGPMVTDEAVTRLCHMTHHKYGFEPTPQKMQIAVEQLCFKNKFNPVVDYLAGLKWDGTPRIEEWLIRHGGAPDTPFVRAVSRLSLVAAVRRARQPGCKFDEIIVLESPEGFNKSSALRVLFGEENFSDQSILGGDDRKQQEQMQGIWGYELADLTGIRTAEVEKVKAFASRQEDRCRPAYGRNMKHQKRQCVLFATTNDIAYLQSKTGNRRWWPIPIGKAIDLKELAAVRDQLWAEAATLEGEGVSIRLPKELWSVAGQEQEERRQRDPWEDLLTNVKGSSKYQIALPDWPCDEAGEPIESHGEKVLACDVFAHTLKIDPGQQNSQLGKRLRQAMTRVGWTYKDKIRDRARTGSGYVRIVQGAYVPPTARPTSEDEDLPADPF